MRALDHVETERKVKFNNMKVQREQSTVVKQLQGKRAFKLMFLINWNEVYMLGISEPEVKVKQKEHWNPCKASKLQGGT